MKKAVHDVVTSILYILITICLLPAGVMAQSRNSDVLVIDGGTLIDGNGGTPVENSRIIIRGNRIDSVTTQGRGRIPRGATVINAEGKFIVPGLMDAHTHYAEWMPELMLNNGITSVFSIGSGGEWSLAHRDAINAGKIKGPRTFVAVGSLAGGRISALSARSGESGGLSGRQVAMDAESAIAITRRFVEAGADMIKVHRGPTIEAYRAAIEEAHKAGLPVVAQPIGPTVYARDAILAGADILEHAAGVSVSIAANPERWEGFGNIERHSLSPLPFADMDEAKARDLIKLMVDRNVYLEPDFIAMGRGYHKDKDKFELMDYRLLNRHELSYVPEANRQRMLNTYNHLKRYGPEEYEERKKGYHNMLRFMKMFVDAGGKVMTGTDTAGWAVPGQGLLHEMQILQYEVGMTPMQVIMSATQIIAEGFKVLDDLGTIEEGKLADIVVVNDDPLEDMSNIYDIEYVIKDGKSIDLTYTAGYESPFPRGAVEGSAWVRALGNQSFQGTEFGQPHPGISAISPNIKTQGDESFIMTIRGVHFTTETVAYFNGKRLKTQVESETELKVNIDASLVSEVGTYPIVVRNPEPMQRPEWGEGTSNKAHLLVNYRY